jgi:hypothetical protein
MDDEFFNSTSTILPDCRCKTTWRDRRSFATQGSVKDFVEPEFLSITVVALTPMVVSVFKIGCCPRLATGAGATTVGATCSGRFIKQFIQFAAVKPYASVYGTLINFYSLAIGHDQGRVRAVRAFHIRLSSSCFEKQAM